MSNEIIIYSTQLKETGGIESHILEFCRNISSPKIKITLVVPNFQMKEKEERHLRAWCSTVIINRGKSGIRTMGWLFVQAFLLNRRKYDALYTNGQGSSIRIISTFFFRYKKWVHHHHTSGDVSDQLTWTKPYRTSLLNSDVVIACSATNARNLQVALPRQFNVIPCFSRRVTNKKSRVFLGGKIRLGYYGRLVKEKGIELLASLSTDPECSHIEFNIWGEGVYGPDWFARFPNLKYNGKFQGEEGLFEVIDYLDGLVLLSTHPEGLPICLLEAMSAGLPWCATNKGGIADIVSDPISTRLLAPELNYERLKAELLHFVRDISDGLIVPQNQIEFYNKNFASAVIAYKWRNVLDLNL